jgi:hypothetical protein
MRYALLLGLALLAGCDYSTLVVESDGAWSGGIFGPQGSEWPSGEGNARFVLAPNARYCWYFKKESGSGPLRAYVERLGPTGPATTGEASTEAIGGEVEGCS